MADAQFCDMEAWVEYSTDGLLNGRSRSASVLATITTIAMRALDEANIPQTATSVIATATALTQVVRSAQKAVFRGNETTGPTSLMTGLATVLVASLPTVLETMPVPFGEDPEQVLAWQQRVSRRLVSVLNVSSVCNNVDDSAEPANKVAGLRPQPDGAA